MNESDQDLQIINSAKLLRRSSDAVICGRVFINPQMTKAEAAAAYQVRLQRRSAFQRRGVHDYNATTHASSQLSDNQLQSTAIQEVMNDNQLTHHNNIKQLADSTLNAKAKPFYAPAVASHSRASFWLSGVESLLEIHQLFEPVRQQSSSEPWGSLRQSTDCNEDQLIVVRVTQRSSVTQTWRYGGTNLDNLHQIDLEDSRLPVILVSNTCHIRNKMNDLYVYFANHLQNTLFLLPRYSWILNSLIQLLI